MTHGIGTIQVKRERGKLVVQGLGQTPRGKRFIKSTEVLKASTIAAKEFKTEMAAAISKLMGEAE